VARSSFEYFPAFEVRSDLVRTECSRVYRADNAQSFDDKELTYVIESNSVQHTTSFRVLWINCVFFICKGACTNVPNQSIPYSLL